MCNRYHTTSAKNNVTCKSCVINPVRGIFRAFIAHHGVNTSYAVRFFIPREKSREDKCDFVLGLNVLTGTLVGRVGDDVPGVGISAEAALSVAPRVAAIRGGHAVASGPRVCT